jgi:PadR family transcriptional regulator, regulatory protein PadR
MPHVRHRGLTCHLDLVSKPYYSANQNSVDQAQLLKGVLELAVLAVISRGETYGYEILSTLESAGFDGVGDASVYGTLRRLEQAGHVTSRLAASDSGPARKYYAVAASGEEQLRAGTESWSRINGALGKLVEQ